MTTLRTYAERLETFRDPAKTPTAADRRALDAAIDLLRGRRYLSTTDAADRLGVGSINTVKGLIKDGLLPGSFQNERGTWQIPLAAVKRLDEDRQKVARVTRNNPYALPISKKHSSRLPRR